MAIAPGAVGTAMQDQIRASPDHVFPQAPRFRDMKRDGALAQPTDVARAIWSVLDRDIDNGAVLHIRGLT